MIELIRSTAVGGDCCAGYIVRTKKECTAEDIKTHALSKTKEWGSIYINGVKACEYKHGNLSYLNNECDFSKKVLSASANGGWSLMDYIIHTENFPT